MFSVHEWAVGSIGSKKKKVVPFHSSKEGVMVSWVPMCKMYFL